MSTKRRVDLLQWVDKGLLKPEKNCGGHPTEADQLVLTPSESRNEIVKKLNGGRPVVAVLEEVRGRTSVFLREPACSLCGAAGGSKEWRSIGAWVEAHLTSAQHAAFATGLSKHVGKSNYSAFEGGNAGRLRNGVVDRLRDLKRKETEEELLFYATANRTEDTSFGKVSPYFPLATTTTGIVDAFEPPSKKRLRELEEASSSFEGVPPLFLDRPQTDRRPSLLFRHEKRMLLEGTAQYIQIGDDLEERSRPYEERVCRAVWARFTKFMGDRRPEPEHPIWNSELPFLVRFRLLVGCTAPKFVRWIQLQMDTINALPCKRPQDFALMPENYGAWSVDHRSCLADVVNFDTLDDVLEAFRWDRLSPLPVPHNLRKSTKVYALEDYSPGGGISGAQETML